MKTENPISLLRRLSNTPAVISNKVATRSVLRHTTLFRPCQLGFLLLLPLTASSPYAVEARSQTAVQLKADSLVEQAARAYLATNYARALQLCEQATQIAPRYPRAWVGLGTTYAALQQSNAAGRAFRQALKVGATGTDAQRAKNGLKKLGLPIREPQNGIVKLPRLTSIPTRVIAPMTSWKAVRTLAVSPDGAFKSIAQAIAAAPPYSRIEVAAGTYQESIIVDKPLQIVGSKLGDVVIENTDATCLSLRATGATVSRLVFKALVSRPDANRFHAVEIPSGRSMLSECEISTESRVGISAYGRGTNPILRRCKVSGARTSGIIVYNSARADIDGCDVSGSGYAGIENIDGGNSFVRGCDIHENRTGVVVESLSSSQLQDCTISKNSWQGVRAEPLGTLMLRRTRVFGNTHDISIAPTARFLSFA